MPSDGYRRYMSSALTKLFIPKQTSVVARERRGGGRWQQSAMQTVEAAN